MSILKNDWNDVLSNEFKKPYYLKLRKFLIEEYENHTVYPDKYDIFNALHYTPLADVKILILGQDPYHGANQAHGLSFSVLPEQKTPPSLKNIYKELHDDVHFAIPDHGYLKKWSDRGVLLLNTVLTVRAHQPNSHRSIGWEFFTDEIIRVVNRIDRPVVSILWGKYAQTKKILLDNPNHLVICSPHPSPFSANRGFFGSRPFSTANNFLVSRGVSPVEWQIT